MKLPNPSLCPFPLLFLTGTSDRAVGTFYEGVMTTGLTSNATDALVMANIVAAGYGK